METIESAVTKWRAELGEAAVSTDPAVLARYQMNVSEFAPREFLAVLWPSSLEDVRRIIAVARAKGVPVHPISTGRSWGFGSALPARGPAALVDLGRMNQILEVDSRFRYLVLEPGTTQAQVADHLATLGGSLKLNVTGAGRDTSIVGNVLDRGCGHLGARIDDLLGVEIVLGNGEVVRTGLWHMHDAAHYYPPGLGPDLRGLFTQSSYGIVTKMALRLHSTTPYLELTLEVEEARLPALIDVLRLARDDYVITGHVRITDGRDPIIRYFRQTERPTWKAQLTVRGTRAMRAEAARELQRRIHGLVERVDIVDTQNDEHQGQSEADPTLAARIGLMNGAPSDRLLEAMAAMTGRSFPDGKPDLDHDRAMPGFLCVNSVVPFSGEHVAQCIATVRAAAKAAGVSISHLFEVAGPTALFGLFAFYFDRNSPTEVAHAHAFKDSLLRRLQTEQIFPVRLDVDAIGPFMERTDDGFWRSAAAIKRAFDPQNIISGRYAPARGLF